MMPPFVYEIILSDMLTVSLVVMHIIFHKILKLTKSELLFHTTLYVSITL